MRMRLRPWGRLRRRPDSRPARPPHPSAVYQHTSRISVMFLSRDSTDYGVVFLDMPRGTAGIPHTPPDLPAERYPFPHPHEVRPLDMLQHMPASCTGDTVLG